MKTRHGMGIGLVGLLLSTVAFAAAPAASEKAEEVTVAAALSEHSQMEEIIVKARHPDAEPKSYELAMYDPLELLRETPIDAPELVNEIKLELKLAL